MCLYPCVRCFRGLPPAQYKLLLGEKNEMSLKDLKELLMDNTVENFDPVAEAFKVRWDGTLLARMCVGVGMQLNGLVRRRRC